MSLSQYLLSKNRIIVNSKHLTCNSLTAENLERVQVVLGDPLDFSSIVARSRILGTTTLSQLWFLRNLYETILQLKHH